MSLRFRRSMKLMPGVRLNFNKNSMGMSFGVPGARYTLNTRGRRTISTGIPGTGLYNVETLSSGSSSSRSRGKQGRVQEDQLQQVPNSPSIKPGLISPKFEREFYNFLLDIYGSADSVVDDQKSVVSKGQALQAKYPKIGYPIDAIMFLHAITSPDTTDVGEKLGYAIWAERGKYFDHPISQKYFEGMQVTFYLTRGITSMDAYNAQSFGLMWAEGLQADARYQEAMDVLQDLEADQLVGIALADLEITMGDFDGAIETTEDIENEDDATAMMLILRGVAFREKGLNEAALECFKRALAKKDRSEGVTHRARYERSIAYVKAGKKAMARKDLEKILVDDPSSKEANEALEGIDK